MRRSWRYVVGTVALLSVHLVGCAAPANSAGAPATPAQENVFDVKALSSTPLNARVTKTTEADGIVVEEVMFHSEMDGEKSVDIFGIFAYPKGARGLPAFIWNQGGLYQATDWFPKLGAKRGYAALCIDFPIPGYRSTGGYPINSEPGMGDDPKQAPIYHGAVALLKAVSYLESRAEVDKNRIGMAGSSWGGFFTTLMAGVDPRLKAASSMFGAGNLQMGNLWWDGNGNSATRDAAKREAWRTTLDPAWRLQNVKIPIAWVTGADDQFYWMPSVSKTYEMAAGPKNLAILPNWNHALTPNLDEQQFAWLDVYLQGKPEFLKVTPITVESKEVFKGPKRAAQWKFSGPRKAVSAELIFSYGADGNWSHRYWQTVKAEIKGDTCTALLPESTEPVYVSGTVIDDEKFRYSTPLLLVKPSLAASKEPILYTAYDGAREWGGFEENDAKYPTLHGYGYPTPVPGGANGSKMAGKLNVGPNALPPILFTAGIPHEFLAYVKSDKATQVTISVGGTFDGKPVSEKKEFAVGTEWTVVRIRFTPPVALYAGLAATITVPEGVNVVIDDVSFWSKATFKSGTF